jgi:O-antigen polymerase
MPLLLLSLIYLFLVHLFLPNIGGVILHPREYLIWVLILGLISFSFARVFLRGELKLPPGRVALLVFILLSLSSALFNPLLNKESFLIGSVHLFAIYLIWLGLNQLDFSRALRDKILLLIFLSAVIEALIGILQLAGLYKAIPITPLVNEQQSFIWGAFQQKNLFGSFIALGIVVSLHLMSSPLIRFRGIWLKGLFFLSVFLLGLNLVFANSRTAWIGFVGGVLILLLFRFGIYRAVPLSTALWSLTLGAGLAVGIWIYGGSEDYRTSLIQRESSNAQRILMLKTSWEMFKEEPFKGHGFGNFESLYMRYQAEVAKEDEHLRRFIGGFVSHPHNEIAYIAVQSGMLGLVGFAVAVVAFARMIYKIGSQKGGLYLGLLFPFSFHSLVEYPLELSVVHYFTFLLILAMLSSHLAERRKLNLSGTLKTAGVLTSAVLFLVTSGWFLLTFRDYMRMVLFVVELDRGSFRPELMEGAVKNLYLRNWAVPLLMIERARKAVKEKDLEFLKEFIPWAREERIRRPIQQLYLMEATALVVLGEEYKNLRLLDESMKVVEEGLKLYPNSEDLKKLRKLIVAKSIGLFVDYLRGSEDGKR